MEKQLMVICRLHWSILQVGYKHLNIYFTKIKIGNLKKNFKSQIVTNFLHLWETTEKNRGDCETTEELSLKVVANLYTYIHIESRKKKKEKQKHFKETP